MMLENYAVSTLQYQLTTERVISIVGAQQWHDDDIPEITNHLLNLLENADLIERCDGADSALYRFCWQQHRWLLHFDYYSQSIWLESESALSSSNEQVLATLLNSLIKNTI
jgi:hypothetical protein